MTVDPKEIASQTTAQLVERFAADARRLGNPRRPRDPRNLKPRTPEFQALSGDLRAVASELRARNAVAEVRPLYDSEEDPVRSFASTQFGAFAPEVAQAAFFGVRFGVSTREALALTQLALDTPAERPNLTGLSDDELVERFTDGAIRLYATRFLDCLGDPADLEIRNNILPHVWDPARELKAHGALAKLVPLMDHPNERVRLDAATACHDIEPQKAHTILSEVAARGREEFDVMDAKRVLERWSRGQGVVWGVA
jgi:HEAT repeat protein